MKSPGNTIPQTLICANRVNTGRELNHPGPLDHQSDQAFVVDPLVRLMEVVHHVDRRQQFPERRHGPLSRQLSSHLMALRGCHTGVWRVGGGLVMGEAADLGFCGVGHR